MLLHFYDVGSLPEAVNHVLPAILTGGDREATVGSGSGSELPGVGCDGGRPNSELRAKTVAERQIESI